MMLCCSEHEEWVPPKQRIKRHHATSKGAMTEATGQTNGTKKSNTFGSGGSAFQVRTLPPLCVINVNQLCVHCLFKPCIFAQAGPLRPCCHLTGSSANWVCGEVAIALCHVL